MNTPVVIWGAGAMGGTIGAHLVRAGYHVCFVDIVPEHVATMRDSGLRITGPIADFRVPADAALPDGVHGPLALVLLCVKAYHTSDAVRTIAPRLASDGVIVSVQNGLNDPLIAEIVGAERTFGCFVNFGADYTGPGVIHYGGRGTVGIRLEPFDGFDPAAYSGAATAAATTASLDALVAHNRRSAKTHSGIWRDLAVRHRRTEVDAQLAPIVRTGRVHGIATPLNARLIEMIHEIERGERAHTSANLDALGAGILA